MVLSKWKKILIAGLVIVFSGLTLSVYAEEKTQVSPLFKHTLKNWYQVQLSRGDLKPDEVYLYSLGQSHIDAAWRWRWRQTRDYKCPLTFGKAIKHMEEFPDFSYHQSAPQYYEWTREVDPELFEKIKQREKEGRWVIVGGMWIEPDCNMPEGESFVRQRLYGQRFYLEHFGHISTISWLLDSFGYNWNLPQIVVKSGAKYMWTSKITWNDTTIFPFHLFWWQAPDGTKILTHICPISAGIPFNAGEVSKFKSTRYLLKPGVKLIADYSTPSGKIEKAKSKDFIPEMAVFYGVGDGGHGPQKWEIKTQLAFQELGYGKIASAYEFFPQLDKYGERIPVWNDELYLEYHRGVMTTHEWIKRANRRAEALMRSLEAICSWAHLLGEKYPLDKITAIWKVILLNQFHDILPGSSIPEVYKDAREHYQWIQNETKNLLNQGITSLAQNINTQPPQPGMEPILVFNPLGWERNDLAQVEVSAGQCYRVFDQRGKEIPSQCAQGEDGKNYLYFSAQVPALGWKVYWLKPGEYQGTGPEAKERDLQIILENDLIKVAVDKKTGWLASLYDKRLKKELLSAPSNKILAFKDQPQMYSAWNISHNYLKNPIPVPEPSSVKIVQKGPVLVQVLVERKGDPTSFKQWITLTAFSPLVRLTTFTDMHWKETLVKVEYNTSIKSDKVWAEIPYAVIARPTHPETPAEKARWEMPCQKWIDLNDSNYGLALLNRGKYGFSLNQEGTGYRLSIIKAAKHPKPMPEAKNVNLLYIPFPTKHTDQGEHWAYLALFPHSGTWQRAEVYKAGYEFNTPLIAQKIDTHSGELPASLSLLSLKSDGAYLASIKKAEDDESLIVRVVEGKGIDTVAQIIVNPLFKITGAWETDLLELNPKEIAYNSKSVSFPIGHFEIKTIKLRLKRR